MRYPWTKSSLASNWISRCLCCQTLMLMSSKRCPPSCHQNGQTGLSSHWRLSGCGLRTWRLWHSWVSTVQGWMGFWKSLTVYEMGGKQSKFTRPAILCFCLRPLPLSRNSVPRAANKTFTPLSPNKNLWVLFRTTQDFNRIILLKFYVQLVLDNWSDQTLPIFFCASCTKYV